MKKLIVLMLLVAFTQASYADFDSSAFVDGIRAPHVDTFNADDIAEVIEASISGDITPLEAYWIGRYLAQAGVDPDAANAAMNATLGIFAIDARNSFSDTVAEQEAYNQQQLAQRRSQLGNILGSAGGAGGGGAVSPPSTTPTNSP